MVGDPIQQIKEAADRARRSDFLWMAATSCGALLGLGIIKQLEFDAALFFCIAIGVGFIIRYQFRPTNSWTMPVQRIVDSELAAKEAELEPLRELRAVVMALPEPIFVVDENDRVELANPAAQAFLGEGVESQHISTVLRSSNVLEAIDEVVAGLPDKSVDFLPPGSVERHWRATVSMMAVPELGRRRILISLHDLTRERRIEQMRADFIANASHELRTPLASLRGFIETMRGPARDDPEAQENFLSIMLQQSLRMGRLIDDLMSLNRIELNEHVPPSGEVDLASAANDVVDGLSPLARQDEVRLNLTDRSDKQAQIIGDRDEIIQVAQNLVDNALKYGGAKGGKIEISVGVGDAPPFETGNETDLHRAGDPLAQIAARDEAQLSDYAHLQVRDFAGGIARGDLPRLTERFYRVDVKSSQARGGTGLGLAIVKHIVNRHRGGLMVESVLNEGSAFTVFFKLKDGATPVEAA